MGVSQYDHKMRLKEIIESGNFLYFWDKEKNNCEKLIGQRKLVFIKRNLSKVWIFVSKGSKQNLIAEAVPSLFIQAFTSGFFEFFWSGCLSAFRCQREGAYHMTDSSHAFREPESSGFSSCTSSFLGYFYSKQLICCCRISWGLPWTLTLETTIICLVGPTKLPKKYFNNQGI